MEKTAGVLMVLCLFLGFLLISCSSFKTIGRESGKEQNKTVLVNSENVKLGRHSLAEKWSANEISFTEKITSIFFLNEEVGWAGGVGKLSKTNNAGNSWVETPLPGLDENEIKDVLFRNKMTGWIALTSKDSKLLDKDVVSKILNTEDGGKSWKVIKVIEGGIIKKMRFDETGNLWIVGMTVYQPGLSRNNANKGVSTKLICYKGLVLKNSEEKEWEEVSLTINKLADARGPNGCLNDDFVGIEFNINNSIYAMTGSGLLIKSVDNGLSWHEYKNLAKNINIPTKGIRSFGVFEDGSVWLLSSIKSIEGTGAQFWLEDLTGNEYIFDFSDKFLTETTKLSDKSLVSIGMKIVPENDGEFAQEAVIVESPDLGKTWREIYNSQEGTLIKSLSVVDENTMWAVSDKNVLIHLRRLIQ